MTQTEELREAITSFAESVKKYRGSYGGGSWVSMSDEWLMEQMAKLSARLDALENRTDG